ncbi:MAG: CDP-glucose 4,6-dehydratase [Zoogloeaceae bacterium]|nr:CDP-glucose 4,6-dehydratase [Zoogloeaceae bacterium]
MVKPAFWKGRKVFLTGHTGFKGSWLALWLKSLGAEVSGYALPAPTKPSLFEIADVTAGMHSTIGDIRDADQLARTMHAACPEIIFHLAAQPLVGDGYKDPVGTYTTNVIGTVNLLEIARTLPGLRCIVVITTDKCYANHETRQAFRESDPLGGRDPYSSSKACAELVCEAYRQSFFTDTRISLATARAGNVIGGGDWAANRLVPDLLRDFSAGRSAKLRNPLAVRPWQHVLEPLAGYLALAEALCCSSEFARAWNFGPADEDCLTTGALADLVAEAWDKEAHWAQIATNFPHEAGFLSLDATAAIERLKWRPIWPLKEAVRHTVAWHRSWLSGENMQAVCLAQISQYSEELQ